MLRLLWLLLLLLLWMMRQLMIVMKLMVRMMMIRMMMMMMEILIECRSEGRILLKSAHWPQTSGVHLYIIPLPGSRRTL